jgi:hypothetical protein
MIAQILSLVLMLHPSRMDLDKLVIDINVSRGFSISIFPSETDFSSIKYWCEDHRLECYVFPNKYGSLTVNVRLRKDYDLTVGDLRSMMMFATIKNIDYWFPDGIL